MTPEPPNRETANQLGPKQNNGVMLAMLVFAGIFFLFWGGGYAGDRRVRWLTILLVSTVISGTLCIGRYLWNGRKGPRALPGAGWLVGIAVAAQAIRAFVPPMWIGGIVGTGIGLGLLGLFRIFVPPLMPGGRSK